MLITRPRTSSATMPCISALLMELKATLHAPTSPVAQAVMSPCTQGTQGSVPAHGSGMRLEVYGREGTLVVTSEGAAQTGELRLLGGKSGDSALEELAIPERLRWVPLGVPQGVPFNVGQLWSSFGEAIRMDKRSEPDFDTAVTLHRLLEAIQKASDTGERQQVT